MEKRELPEEVSSIVNIIEDKKGQDIKVYNMEGRSPFFDYSILCTGSSSRNIEAIATDIKKSMDKVRNIEGLDECNWVLIDGGDIIVSIFSKEAREYYQLDSFYEGVDSGNLYEDLKAIDLKTENSEMDDSEANDSEISE